eukprot:ANDGO_02315.mRNA.1 Glutathione S-transferase class-mu 28 kDa isozyme
MVHAELRYFDCRGRGQIIRYILLDLLADSEYTETVIPLETFQESWSQTRKNDADFSGIFGTIPVLVWTDAESDLPITISQTLVILQFLGRKLNLYGPPGHDDLRTSTRIDELVSAAYTDLIFQVNTAIWQSSTEVNVTAVSKLDVLLQRLDGYLASKLREWEVETGYFVFSDKETLADYALFAGLELTSSVFPSLFAKYPRLVQFEKMFREKHPRIQQYISSDKCYKRYTGASVEKSSLKVIAERFGKPSTAESSS